MKQHHHYAYKFLLGLFFGFGLIVSGMIYPSKVVGFLDLFGTWDPSLLFVMVGAIAVYAPFFAYTRNSSTVLGYDKRLTMQSAIDARLVTGAGLFGIGWGLYGLCPAPSLVAVGTLSGSAIVFVISMLAGMFLYDLVNPYLQ